MLVCHVNAIWCERKVRMKGTKQKDSQQQKKTVRNLNLETPDERNIIRVRKLRCCPDEGLAAE